MASSSAKAQPPATQPVQRNPRNSPAASPRRTAASARIPALPGGFTPDGLLTTGATLFAAGVQAATACKGEQRAQLKAERDAAVASAAQQKAEVERLQQAVVIHMAALEQSQADLKAAWSSWLLQAWSLTHAMRRRVTCPRVHPLTSDSRTGTCGGLLATHQLAQLLEDLPTKQ
ncbi:hypothetical protein D9Q98_005928 [Chlorella vulgaris]|uniref:Uncharacterized protein n=1 Tax=Chlorella vulgaris TaxID=3077 RepID=A0A9D4TWN0_CHLVU|nr:hypothetical protein D9Q98_005928 [Chlorella vulgaris]